MPKIIIANTGDVLVLGEVLRMGGRSFQRATIYIPGQTTPEGSLGWQGDINDLRGDSPQLTFEQDVTIRHIIKEEADANS